MKPSRKDPGFTYLLISALLLIVVVFAYIRLFGHRSETNLNDLGHHGHYKSFPRKYPEFSDKTNFIQIRSRLREGKYSSEDVILVVEDLIKSEKFDESDIEESLISILPSLSPSQLGQLMILLADGNQGRKVRLEISKIVAGYDNVDYVIEFLEKIGKRDNLKSNVMYRLGRDSVLLELNQIEDTLQRLNDFGVDFLGRGLADRLEKLSGEERRKALINYFEVIHHKELTGQLTRQWVELELKLNPEAAKETIDWILSQESDLVKDADKKIMENISSHDVESAVYFINELIARNEVDRASKAALGFVEAYRIHEPENAFEWALNLPDVMSDKHQAIVSSYISLVLRDQEKSKIIAEKIENESLRNELLQLRENFINQKK